MVERARQSREELATFRQQQAEGPDGDDGELASPAKRRAAKRRASKQAERLELAAADNLSQVRAVDGVAGCLIAMRLLFVRGPEVTTEVREDQPACQLI